MEHRTPDAGMQVAELFVPLTDSTRLRLLEFVVDRSRTVAECGAHLDVSCACAAEHLRTLVDFGWITGRVIEGQVSYGPSAQAAELMSLVGAMAADRSNVMASCAHINGQGGDPPV